MRFYILNFLLTLCDVYFTAPQVKRKQIKLSVCARLIIVIYVFSNKSNILGQMLTQEELHIIFHCQKYVSPPHYFVPLQSEINPTLLNKLSVWSASMSFYL